MDLLDALARPEGKELEFKRDLSSPTGLLRTVVAFANTSGGLLLIGVEDGTRDVRGLDAPVAAADRLTSTLMDGIAPLLVPDVQVLPYRSTHVLAVRVHPSGGRPHHLRREGAEAGTYVRVGASNRRADADLIAELRRFARGASFDEEPVPDTGVDALDEAAMRAAFGARGWRPGLLASLRLTTRHQGRAVATVGGLLLFGRDPSARFPDAWLQLGRFAGGDRARVLDHAELRGPLVAVVDQAVAFVAKHAWRGLAIEGVRHVERWNLPPVAVRELIVNAVAHADYALRGAPLRVAVYDDRLEVENPGLLPFGLSVDDLPFGVSKLRNRVIGRVFRELGLMEQWGSGVPRVIAACREAGLPAPRWEEIGLRFRATLWAVPTAEPRLDAVDRGLLRALEGGDGRRTRDLAASVGLTTRATRTRLARLVERGLVRDVGLGPNDPRRRYVAVERAIGRAVAAVDDGARVDPD